MHIAVVIRLDVRAVKCSRRHFAVCISNGYNVQRGIIAAGFYAECIRAVRVRFVIIGRIRAVHLHDLLQRQRSLCLDIVSDCERCRCVVRSHKKQVLSVHFDAGRRCRRHLFFMDRLDVIAVRIAVLIHRLEIFYDV